MNSDAQVLNVQMSGCRDCIHVLRSVVEVIANRIGLDALQANRVTLAVDEMYANIIRHSYHDELGLVEFEAKAIDTGDEKMGLIFVFRDYAEPLSDTAFCSEKSEQEIHDIKVGGLGMHLICSVMDMVKHEPMPDGNRWIMAFGCEGVEGNGNES